MAFIAITATHANLNTTLVGTWRSLRTLRCCKLQVSCWGPLFCEPSPEGTEPPHETVGALVLRLTIKQRQIAQLIENEAPDNALDAVQVTHAEHSMTP